MSKQSFQRYQKDKEKEHLKKAGINVNETTANMDNENKAKFNREFDTTSDKADK